MTISLIISEYYNNMARYNLRVEDNGTNLYLVYCIVHILQCGVYGDRERFVFVQLTISRTETYTHLMPNVLNVTKN